MGRFFRYIARTCGVCKVEDVAVYIGKDVATVTRAVRFVENLLKAGDQQAVTVIKRVRGHIAKRRVSWEERGRGKAKMQNESRTPKAGPFSLRKAPRVKNSFPFGLS
jgi:hypothetical protein